MEAKIEEMINEAVLYMVDNYDDEWALDIQTILEKHLSQEQEELDKRDNDLCNIHNSELSRSDMYMEIIWYLVNKWFLQEEYKA